MIANRKMSIKAPITNRVLSTIQVAVAATAFLVAYFTLAAPADAQTVAVMDGQVHTATGSVIEGGDILIRDGRISAIGQALTVPDGASVIDASGRIVTPGLIAAHSQIGLTEIGAVRDSNDTAPGDDFALGAALRAEDAFNPVSTLIDINRAGGVTRALSLPGAGRNLFGGSGIIVDMTGKPDAIMVRGAAMSVQLDASASGQAGGTRMGSWASVREILDDAQLYANDPAGYRRLATDGRYTSSDLAALVPVLSGRAPLFVAVDRAADIRNVIRFKNDYNLDIVIVGGQEAWKEGAALAAAGIPVILDPLANLPASFDELFATLKNAPRLHAAGVKIAFYNPPGFGTHNLRRLTQLAGNAVAEGLPFDAAIEALTRMPAEILGIDDQVGTIEVGKRADLVIWDGDPLELTSAPVAVLIDGAQQDLRHRSQMLRDRYKDLSRGGLPHAYRGGE